MLDSVTAGTHFALIGVTKNGELGNKVGMCVVGAMQLLSEPHWVAESKAGPTT